MKNKIFIILDMLLYILFSCLYSSEGFKYQLATKTSELHKFYINNKYYYDYYVFDPISPLLSKIGLIGMILTGIFFIIIVTYRIYKKFEINNPIKWKTINKINVIVLSVIICLLLLHVIRQFIYINFFMLVGE